VFAVTDGCEPVPPRDRSFGTPKGNVTMRKSMKAALAVAAAATFALGTALPASANDKFESLSGCTVDLHNTISGGYASSHDPHRGCGTMRVRHLYVVQGGYGYWTAWSAGDTRYVASNYADTLSYSQHQVTVNGAAIVIPLPGS
jgi:hypothetical protein